MSRDGLKLTTYFGERDRTTDGLLGDELMGLYAREGIETSVLLRGAEGFGGKQHLRSDRLLTLSEDLPVVSVAVDERERIEALVEPVLALQRSGLVTMERADLAYERVDTGNIEGAQSPVTVPRRLADGAVKVTVYVDRYARARGAPAFVTICELLRDRGLDGASVLLGVDGTRGGARARARFFSRNAEIPVMVIAVGASESVAAALAELSALAGGATVTTERVAICKRDGEMLRHPKLDMPAAPSEEGWQKLMIYTSQSATHEGRPLSREIVRRLRAAGAAGATTLHGIWGFHGEHGPHGDRLLQVRRRVPALTVAVEREERIGEAFAIVDELTAEHGLVTCEAVPRILQASRAWPGVRSR